MSSLQTDVGLLQTLLNAEAVIDDPRIRKQIVLQLEKLRGETPPTCFGDDDCSALILSMCPWRMTCGVVDKHPKEL